MPAAIRQSTLHPNMDDPPAPGDAAEPGGRFPALGHREYRWLWGASAASAVALWSTIMARAWLALDLTDSGLAIGVVTFAAIGPFMLSPLGGVLADRFDRARILQTARSISLLLSVTLAVLAFTDVISFWQLALLAFGDGLARSVEKPAEFALLPNTVRPSALMNAIALSSLAMWGSRAIGPTVGGPLLAGGGAGGVFVLAAAFQFASIMALTRVRVRSTGDLEGAQGSVVEEVQDNLRQGLAYVGRVPAVRMIFAITALHCMLTMSFDTLLPILARDELAGGERLFAWMITGIGVGALIGTLALSTVGSGASRGALFLVTGVISGLAVLSLGLAPTTAAAIAAVVVVGASQAVFMALSITMIQSVVPDALRGRVMSLYLLSAGGVMSLMMLANGGAADVIGVRVLLVGPAIVFVLVLLAWSLAQGDLRAVYRSGALRVPAGGAA